MSVYSLTEDRRAQSSAIASYYVLSLLPLIYLIIFLIILVTTAIDHITEPQHGLFEHIGGFALMLPGQEHISNQPSLYLPILWETDFQGLKVCCLRSATITVPRRNGSKSTLIVTTSQQTGQELWVEPFIGNAVDWEFLCHERTVELLLHHSNAAFPEVNGREDNIAGVGSKPG